MNNHIINEWIKACELGERHDFFRRYPLDDRVYRLFSVACFREVWDQLEDESKKAVEIAELYADKLVTIEELIKAQDDAWAAAADANSTAFWAAVGAYAAYAAVGASIATKEFQQQGLILASMCPVDFNDNWINPTTTALAHNIYNNKDFSLMPILADALQDVNCTEDILLHLRSKGPFYKGNYIIDVLTGKRL